MRSSILRRRASLGTALAALGVGLTVLSAHPAAAQTTMVADDINPIAGSAGQAVTGFSFSMANFNSAAVSSAPTVYFYDSSGSGGGPGALLGGVRFNPISLAATTYGVFNYNPGTALFTLPSTTFWAGISFNSTTATADQLNNMGQAMFNPPTVGSSQDVFFQSNNPATTANNPAGGLFNFTGGSPVANFGWSFRTGSAAATTVYSNTTGAATGFYVNGGALPTPAPEASTTVSLGLMLALGMGGLAVASRRKKAGAKA